MIDFLTPVLFGICLSMDNFAMSLVIGTMKKVRFLYTPMAIALSFGLFQAGMILIGWFVGINITTLITGYSMVIAVALLAVLGVKMILDGLKKKDEDIGMICPASVLTLSLFMSVDTLAAGMSFGILHSPILITALVIGSITFLLSFAGVMAGKRLKIVFENKSGIVGGVILIALSIRFLMGMPLM
jgi:manganese efflux pump family protein